MPHAKTPLVYENVLRLADHHWIEVGSHAWFTWLTQVSSFSYQLLATTHRLTLRQEKRRHRYYWYAYLKRGGKLHNTYVGPTHSLTPERLQQIGLLLIAKVQAQRILIE